jgi:D-beta-D-heptose 7-phosphate kinase/D-beta-D-heptose 1-phosphate adenosyltransferase
MINAVKNKKIIVIGDLMLDQYLIGEAKRISPEAPVPVVNIMRQVSTAGGAANVANNLAALGVKVQLVGVIGDDDNGKEMIGYLNGVGIDTSGVIARPGLKTITKSRVVASNQQICRIDWDGDSSQLCIRRDELNDKVAAIQNSDAVIISDYAKGVVNQLLIDEIKTVARNFGVFVAVDPKPKRALDISGINLMTPNRSEALELCGKKNQVSQAVDISEIADIIHNRFKPQYLVITLSEDGILYSPGVGKAEVFPTVACEVADVSGAGDTVVAILTAAIVSGIAPCDAVKIANIGAGIVVSKRGTATASIQEIENAMAEFNGCGISD